MKANTLGAATLLFVAPSIAATCNADNVYRCLLASTQVASRYCSSYLSVPVSTVVVSTVTPVTTIFTTIIGTQTTIVTSTATTTSTIPQGFAKRVDDAQAVAPAVTSPAPKCLVSGSSTLFPASRISSACSCFSVTRSRTSITATAPAKTSIITSSRSTTTTLITLTTSTTVAPMQACPTLISTPDAEHTRYYKGSGFIESSDNPGNNDNDFPPQTTTFPGSTLPCDVLQQCANYASTVLAGGYYSFDLHYLTSRDVYECTVFINGNFDPSFFDVGYSF